MNLIPVFPLFAPLSLDMRSVLHPVLDSLSDGISEFTFSSLFVHSGKYCYQVSQTDDGCLIFCGVKPTGLTFFHTPQKLPPIPILAELCTMFDSWELIPPRIALQLIEQLQQPQQVQLAIKSDSLQPCRNDFDYVYSRNRLASLSGNQLHKKRNLVNSFVTNYHPVVKPLDSSTISDALYVLDLWQKNQIKAGNTNVLDYAPAKKSLEYFTELGFYGLIAYSKTEPIAWGSGELMQNGTICAVHFEKAQNIYKGAYQFINKALCEMLPESVVWINREQDLGDEGLRQAKMTYFPDFFVEKYRWERS